MYNPPPNTTTLILSPSSQLPRVNCVPFQTYSAHSLTHMHFKGKPKIGPIMHRTEPYTLIT